MRLAGNDHFVINKHPEPKQIVLSSAIIWSQRKKWRVLNGWMKRGKNPER